MKDFIFNGTLADLDRDVFDLSQIEAERQVRKLIMIPSESMAPLAVRETLSTAFQNVYAEGYPDEEMRALSEPEILDLPARLAEYRRYSDPRFYKGVEYVDIIESLARRRCAELFAANGKSADELYVNVQPLSGAPANNAVYPVVANPGDTILAMSLLHGGHLSHGSSVNRSGKFYKIVHYLVDPVTEKIDYDAVQGLASEHKPKMIIAGYTSYPWVPDWARFRQIADSVGAVLLADISHIAGMVAAGVVPSPVGYAQIITFTTHKTLCGPRGACIVTTDSTLAKKLDKSVFPGEQGGPHVNTMAAMAVAFKLDQTEQFKELQQQIVTNCKVLCAQLEKRGLRIPYGGSDTHLMNLDCRTITGPDGTPLSGDMAARILDLAGIVANRNTIPGDKSSLAASGIRMGTPWLTQRGFKEKEMTEIANLIADLLLATKPYTIETRKGPAQRAKIDFNVFEDAKLKIRRMAEQAARQEEVDKHPYPHFFYLDDIAQGEGYSVLECRGETVREFLNYALTSDVEALHPEETQTTRLMTAKGAVDGSLYCADLKTYQLTVHSNHFGLAATWLRDLSDGFIAFDPDPSRRMPGPVIITEILSADPAPVKMGGAEAVENQKPYFIGMNPVQKPPLPAFTWKEAETPLRKTPLNDLHRKMGAKMVPFAGWDMPVWYTSVIEEHHATRSAAGLFDVSHMGVYQAEGPDAAAFLDSVCGNDIASLAVGESCYTHFLTPDAEVIDDTLVYHRDKEKFLVVVNASNDDKDWAWLNSVREGSVRVDQEHPWVKAFGRGVNLRNLRDPKEGKEMRVDIALQGPKSRDILLSLGVDNGSRKRIMALKRTELCDAVVGGFDLIVSRTGYTGEKMAFELFVHPDQAPALWEAILKAGEPLGLKACGLGARDSLRTEAGLPLYGHEMAGDLGLGVAEAGFGSYVKTYKPWFIGRDAYLRRESQRSGVVVRFRFTEKGVRMAHHGDPVTDKKGKVIGWVTSCAIDSEGFLTGQAYLEISAAAEGTPIAVFQGKPKELGKNPPELKIGDRVILPTPAEVISRFPK